tara:strand:- start:172 stop:1950 length:1779 start_codon:yes stop_codon:yes gene_type:complete
MKKLYIVIPIILLMYLSCEDKREGDTTPPTVTITFPQNNTTVFELVSITCISSDNEGVEKVELWLDGVSTGMTDETEPYIFKWNTNDVDNGNYTITIRSYDSSGNTTDSQPIILSVDNTRSNPQPVNITSLVFENGSFNITWNPSTDGDFDFYELEKSVESSMNDYTVVYSSNEVGNTNYVDTDVDPLIYQYYRVTVIDTFDYQSKGEIYSSSLYSVPTSVNIESVEYDTEQMTISWSESQDDDFKHYNLLQSESENGNKTLVTTISDQSTTSYTITNFNPLIENWFWLQVTDTLGLSSIGNGMTNEIDSPPTPSVLYPILYNYGFQISWSQNNDNDFHSYKLYESLSEDMSDWTLVYETNDRTNTSFDLTLEVLKYYQIIVEDKWSLHSMSNIEIGDYDVELWGENYSVVNTTILNISHSGLEDSIPPEIGNLTNLERLTLHWNGLTGSIPPEIGNLTNLIVLSLSGNDLEGSIPPEIGNLTNLVHLIVNNNNLEGSIPTEIGNLVNLSHLDLSWNELEGSIPSEIGNLVNLISLKLVLNNLTGVIPESICDLNVNWSFLSNFNISENQLCPPYPSCIENYVGNQDTSGCD